MSDSPSLIFTQKNLLESTLVDSSGALHYTTTTTTGLRGRKVTTITGANAVGKINWREQTFAIGDVCRGWDALRSRVGGGEREWKWDKRVYTLTYVNAYKELLATPTSGPTLTPVRFTAPSTHVLHPWEPATITFPPQLQDGQENLFALMAILQTETMHTDKNHGSGLSAAIDSVSLFN
ncbi:hypothetical protein DFH08DRAFT_810200 [Mycena albidolilacea]|uniref:Uncharacterized protein n=1 Tax=Mycena albidolilacea TaxID=1033008 RepID=A0AAD7ERT0_9AGAR|nr:hypothetical protein DFH08DRAFT_810200 [Mycena albidolilacea]